MHRLSGFDLLAPVYDILARIVFGRSITAAQICHLEKIGQNSNVLILGGGTGWILREIYSVAPNCKIWYIDASPMMIASARKKSRFSEVHFICDDAHSLPPVKFDAVITNFFFDMFSSDSVNKLVVEVGSHISENCIWLVSEFRSTGHIWSRVLLGLMYNFFRILCHIEANCLPQWEASMRRAGFIKISHRQFYFSMIQSEAYLYRQLG